MAEKKEKSGIWILMVFIFLIFALWLAYWQILLPKVAYDFQTRGQFGDMFGGINALFAGFAFAGLIYTIWQQRKELGLQRQELELTRKELEGQKEQLKKQNHTSFYQLQLNIYFNLLSLHNDLKRNLRRPGQQVEGPQAFDKLMKAFSDSYKDLVRSNPQKQKKEMLSEAFERNYKGTYSQYFSNYFNTVELILAFLRSNFACKSQSYYPKLFRAQFSEIEIAMLFYYGLSKWGASIKPLIEEFGFLRFIDKDRLLDQEHLGYYDSSAYDDES
ncbi:MAG TPA: hypothetical protein ENO22_02425 [candidate division Zixibacteria bacterium]|nr:hypothetical protein [candidate division Zixibacteria bacterium]